jgi:sugar phosphate isomerase/epimerase
MGEIPVAIITDEFGQDFEQICTTATELGVSALEVRTIWDKNIADMSDAEVSEIDKLAKASGLQIVSVASPVFKCTLPDGGDIDHRFEQDAFHSAHTFEDQPRILQRSLAIAHVLGSPIVRVFSFWRTVNPKQTTKRVVEALRGAAEMAAPMGIKIGLENEHACNIATDAEAAEVLAAIDHPNLGLVWDPANAYVAGEIPFPDGYNCLPHERILHVHAKDGAIAPGSDRVMWSELGKGHVDWQGQLAALAQHGYPGLISLETHWGGPGGDKFQGSCICARNLKQMVGRAAPGQPS